MLGLGRNIERVSGHAYGQDQSCLECIWSFMQFHFLWHGPVHARGCSGLMAGFGRNSSPTACIRPGSLLLPAHVGPQTIPCECPCTCAQGCSSPPASLDRNIGYPTSLDTYMAWISRSKRIQGFRCFHFLVHVLVHVPKAAQVSLRPHY